MFGFWALGFRVLGLRAGFRALGFQALDRSMILGFWALGLLGHWSTVEGGNGGNRPSVFLESRKQIQALLTTRICFNVLYVCLKD